MSDSTVYNLLVGSHDLSTVSWGDKAARSGEKFHGAAVADLGAGQRGIEFPTSAHRADARVTSGAEYVLSFWARADVDGDKIHSEVWGSLYRLDATLTTEWQQVVMPYGIRKADERRVYFWGLGTNSGTVHVALPMCVHGTEPAAWAPAEGETLAGGGALMSANLLDGITPRLKNGTTESDGVWHNAGRTSTDGHDDWLVWDLAGQSALATNQTYHVGLSTRGASANSTSISTTIGYKDAAGNVNWVTSVRLPIGTSWGRAEATIVVPSGMTPFGFYVAAHGTCPETWMASPTLSYGSPVTLASSAHTPYATQDHVMVTYATQASLKVTDDSIKAEVTERGKLAGRVDGLESTSSTHTSKLEQLATSIKSLVKGESTYTDPDGKSVTSGIYSLVTQTRDSVTALFGQYTKTDDLAATDAVKDAKKAGTDAQAAASAAQSTADSAKSTAQDAKKTADGISVGGRNIARGTATLTNDVQAGEHTRWFGTCDYLGGIKSMGVSTAWSGIYFRLKDMADAGRIKAGQQYTASVYVMSETDLTTTFRYYRFTSSSNKPTVDELTGSNYEVVDLKAGEWHQLKCTFTATSGDDSTLTSNRARIENMRNVEVWYAGPKLDSGNRATDYSPAPEDVDAAIGTAQDTANSASSTAGAAKSTADSLATMIREDATGITVGKSADGQTWSTGRTHMTADSFDVLDKAGTVISSFGAKLVSLLKGTFQIKVWDGHSAGAMLQADDLSLSSKYQTMVSSVAPKASEGSMASAADTVYSSGATKSPDGVSELAITNEVFDASDESLGTTKLTTDGFTTNVPLEAAVTRTTLATGVVLECTCGIAVLQVGGVKNSTTTSSSWNGVQIGTVPSAYLPKQKVYAPAAKMNNVDCGMTYIEVDPDGKVYLTDIGGPQTHGQFCYGTLSWVYTG